MACAFFFGDMENEPGITDQTKPEPSARSLRGKRHSKKQGELAELAFIYKAASLGLDVAKPWGDSGRYDFIVDSGTRLWRIQVKSTYNFDGYGYRIGTYWKSTTKHVCYTAEQVDFLAGLVVPEDVWYILPVPAFAPRKVVAVYPHRSTDHGQYEMYREAWHLLKDDQSASHTTPDSSLRSK